MRSADRAKRCRVASIGERALPGSALREQAVARVSHRGRRAARNRDRAAARRDVATGAPGDGPHAVARRRRCRVEAT